MRLRFWWCKTTELSRLRLRRKSIKIFEWQHPKLLLELQVFNTSTVLLLLLLHSPVNYANWVNGPPLLCCHGSFTMVFFARPIFAIPLQRQLWFSNALINLRWKKVGVAILVFHITRNCESSIVLNHHNLEQVPANNNISIFISIVWAAVRPLWVPISGKFLYNHSFYNFSLIFLRIFFFT